MSKIITALLVGLFALSVNAFAADAASKPASETAAPAKTEKPAAPAKKADTKKHDKKAEEVKPAAAK